MVLEASGEGIAALMPIIAHVIEFLTELVQSGNILLSDDMKRWMGEVVCAMWQRLYRSKFR